MTDLGFSCGGVCLSYVILFAAGVFAGFVNVMAGGGSMLTIPMLLFVGLPGAVANGTNRIAILVQNVSAVFAFYRKGLGDWRTGLKLALCTIPGTLVGAMMAVRVGGRYFNVVLALVMGGVLMMMSLPPRKRTEGVAVARVSRFWGYVLLVGVGFWGGFIQMGVGLLLMPVLNRAFGFDWVTTNMHKVFIVLVYTLFALPVFAWQLELDWLAGGVLAAGMATGAGVSTHLQVKRGSGMVGVVLRVVVMVFIVKLLLGI